MCKRFHPLRVLILCLIFVRCFSFELSEEKARKEFPQGLEADFINYSFEGRNIRYVRIDTHKKNPKRTVLVFVHGSPGGWGDYISYMKNPKLQKLARLISLDRPGYGASGRGKAVLSLKVQSRLLLPILLPYHNKAPVILVGHSLGASLVTRMAMDYPNSIQALLLIAGPLSPELEEPAWYNRVGAWPLVRWLLPTDLRTSNREILPLKNELRAMLPFWKKIKMPLTLIHGKEDALVPPENASFLRKVLLHKNFRILEPEKEGHFILWKNKDLITKEILALIKKVEER